MAATVYGQRWKNLGSLGEGGQGFVYRVSDVTGAEAGEWALKRLKKLDRVERFKREVEILRNHPHENIVPLIDAQVEEDGNEADNYLVMPIAKHGDLTKRLPIYKGHIGSVVEVALQIARALDFIHAANVVHRDIKPGNILFPDAGHKVWVADFGLAFDPDAIWTSPEGEVIGPRGFTAPELEVGDPGKATPSADIYSLGRLIFYMLSGGRHVARDNIFDPAHDAVFAKGERYTNLRLLLHRMVVDQPTRTAQMKDVIVELERLEKWEERAVALIVGKDSLAAIDQLKKRTTDKLAIRAENAAARKSEGTIINAVTTIIDSWLEVELGKLRDHIAVEGAIKTWVSKGASPHGQGRFQVQTGTRTGLVAMGGAALGMLLLDDPFQVQYKLNILICHDRTVTIQTIEKRWPASDPQLAAIAVFTQSPRERKDQVQFLAFFRGPPVRHGVPDPLRAKQQASGAALPSAMHLQPQVQLYQTYHDGLMRILRFKASEWPSAQAELAEMIDAAVQESLKHILSPYHSFGP
jgi:serine/threonine protein kinase